MGFTKLHTSLLNSSVWNADDATRIVWITMLVMCDAEGMVRSSLSGLAHQARKSIEDTRKAVEVLLAPDPDSSRPDHDGRRIEPIEGGWRVLNHGYYRELGMSDSAKEYWKQKKRQQRSSRSSRDNEPPKSEAEKHEEGF